MRDFLLFFKHLAIALICIFDMNPKSSRAVMRLKQLRFINSFIHELHLSQLINTYMTSKGKEQNRRRIEIQLEACCGRPF
jgi:hypothetical protein